MCSRAHSTPAFTLRAGKPLPVRTSAAGAPAALVRCGNSQCLVAHLVDRAAAGEVLEQQFGMVAHGVAEAPRGAEQGQQGAVAADGGAEVARHPLFDNLELHRSDSAMRVVAVRGVDPRRR